MNAFVAFSEPTTQDTGTGSLVVAVKANICTTDMPTSCSSKFLKGMLAQRSDCLCNLPNSLDRFRVTVRCNGRAPAQRIRCTDNWQDKLRRVWDGVNYILVPLQLFLRPHRSLNVHSFHGPVINPFQHPSSSKPWEDREQRCTGGSSGGSAAAVAAGICDA
jgi:aspartyl-tRNA(Asn)/glutamyl-tRNA(Gln) amidotransferase subunit A